MKRFVFANSRSVSGIQFWSRDLYIFKEQSRSYTSIEGVIAVSWGKNYWLTGNFTNLTEPLGISFVFPLKLPEFDNLCQEQTLIELIVIWQCKFISIV